MKMETADSIGEARNITVAWRKEGLSIGFVPTMGYLHDGHRSLVERAAAENDRVVVSIFVNPAQFGPGEDFEKYPRDIGHDMQICGDAGASLIFAPASDEMYPGGFSSYIMVNGLTEGLCGASRPGHFKGVCTVVGKLFNIIRPDRAYFGEKDAQQLAVVRRMAQDIDFGVEIVGCPIVREPDGLAMSSRNAYLSPAERKAALVLKRSLDKAVKLHKSGENNADKLKTAIVAELESEPLARIDYVDIVDADTMKKVAAAGHGSMAAMAVFIRKTRLIDNCRF